MEPSGVFSELSLPAVQALFGALTDPEISESIQQFAAERILESAGFGKISLVRSSLAGGKRGIGEREVVDSSFLWGRACPYVVPYREGKEGEEAGQAIEWLEGIWRAIRVTSFLGGSREKLIALLVKEVALAQRAHAPV